MKQNGRNIFKTSTTLATLVGILLMGIILFKIFQTAQHKNFWGDEKNEIATLCKNSYGQMIAGGKSSQASQNPLYLVLQKFSLSQIDTFGSNILVHARRVSIAAALLTCLMLFIFFHTRLGLLFAVFIVISLGSQYLFYHYAAESRLYMSWLLLFALLVLSTFKMCLHSYEKSTLKDRIFFGLINVGITLVMSLGVIQSVTAISTCLFFWYFVHERPKNLNPLINFAVPLCLVCIFIQGYYTLQGVHAFYPNVMESQFDVINQIKKGDISLLKMPARLLLPKPDRDAYVGAYLSNIFVLLGMGMPLLWWKKRKILKDKDFFAVALSMVTSIQVAATLVIALLIAFLHYWFVQRIFLYLIVCHALLATMGVYFLLSLNKRILNFVLKAALGILFYLFLSWHWQSYSNYQKEEPIHACQQIAGYLDDHWQKKLKDIYRDTPKDTYAFLDYLIETNRHLEDCGWDGNPHAQRVSLWRDPAGKLFLGDNSPVNSSPVLMCGRPVYFKLRQ